MSNISEIRVNLSSDDRALLKAAGENNETRFVRGAVASALKELADAQPDEPVEPEPEPEPEPEEESSEDGEE